MSSWRGRDPRLAKDFKKQQQQQRHQALRVCVCESLCVPTSMGESSGVPPTMGYGHMRWRECIISLFSSCLNSYNKNMTLVILEGKYNKHVKEEEKWKI